MKRGTRLITATMIALALTACSSAPSTTGQAAPSSAESTPSAVQPSPHTSTSSLSATPSQTTTSLSEAQLRINSAIAKIKEVKFTQAEQSSSDFPALHGNYLITNARAAVDGSVERVIVEYDGTGELEWQAAWVKEATTQGKGDAIDVSGNAILDVTIAGTRYPEDGEDDNILAAFPTTQVISDIYIEPSFEGMQQIVIGTTEQVPYRVNFDASTGILLIEFQR
ncbi:MAG: hypothetical protein LKJ57_06155 [Ancrocorticia sp.]|nr:hypothetical protein [Ancrocorticia sp.]MCI2013165.1 hypothetical protein [Ancrocorticia sp.]